MAAADRLAWALADIKTVEEWHAEILTMKRGHRRAGPYRDGEGLPAHVLRRPQEAGVRGREGQVPSLCRELQWQEGRGPVAAEVRGLLRQVRQVGALPEG